jgi:hypothetical protein
MISCYSGWLSHSPAAPPRLVSFDARAFHLPITIGESLEHDGAILAYRYEPAQVTAVIDCEAKLITLGNQKIAFILGPAVEVALALVPVG